MTSIWSWHQLVANCLHEWVRTGHFHTMTSSTDRRDNTTQGLLAQGVSVRRFRTLDKIMRSRVTAWCVTRIQICNYFSLRDSQERLPILSFGTSLRTSLCFNFKLLDPCFYKHSSSLMTILFINILTNCSTFQWFLLMNYNDHAWHAIADWVKRYELGDF